MTMLYCCWHDSTNTMLMSAQHAAAKRQEQLFFMRANCMHTGSPQPCVPSSIACMHHRLYWKGHKAVEKQQKCTQHKCNSLTTPQQSATQGAGAGADHQAQLLHQLRPAHGLLNRNLVIIINMSQSAALQGLLAHGDGPLVGLGVDPGVVQRVQLLVRQASCGAPDPEAASRIPAVSSCAHICCGCSSMQFPSCLVMQTEHVRMGGKQPDLNLLC